MNFSEALEEAKKESGDTGADFFASLPTLSSTMNLPQGELIQDERGVRLARVEED